MMLANTALRRMRLGALAQTGASSAGTGNAELAVSGINAYVLREPVSRRAYTVVEVQTKGGLTGYGECPAATPEVLALAKQAAVGKAATSYQVIGRQLAANPGMQAAVGMALLDIVGKYTKAPVYQVLGGPTRNKARSHGIRRRFRRGTRRTLARGPSAGWRRSMWMRLCRIFWSRKYPAASWLAEGKGVGGVAGLSSHAYGKPTLPPFTEERLGFELSEEALKKYPFGGTKSMARVFHKDGSVAEW